VPFHYYFEVYHHGSAAAVVAACLRFVAACESAAVGVDNEVS